ncbi:MAG: transglutaminase-like domain-containing protein [Candidatus Binatia bacterium]
MLVKRSIGVAIVIFWCVMNVLLLKRQLWAPSQPLTIPSVETITESMQEWWGVFYRGEKIGYATQTIDPKSDGYRIQDHSVLHLNLLGTTQSAETRLNVDVDREWTLQRFEFELRSNDVRFKARGYASPGKLALEVDSAGHITKKDIPLSQRPYLLAALKPYVATQQLEPGKEHHFSTFDPSTLSQQVTTVVIEGREHIRIGDRLEPAIRVRQRFKGIAVTSWLDGTGRTLKEESPAGLSLVRQSRQKAMDLSGSRSVSLDLIAESSILPDKPIIRPDETTSVTLRISGIDLANFPLVGNGRQKLRDDRLEIKREDVGDLTSTRFPVRDRLLNAFIQPTPFLQSDHPRIRALAREIIGGEKDARKAALRIKDWVYREIAKEATVSIPNALEVLQTKRGDCNEHTVLFNALARAAGIPAKTVVGVVHLRGAFYYHAWSEIWLGQWVSLDPVLNQFPADATHIKFLEGEIDRQIDILQLIGNLKIQVVEVS